METIQTKSKGRIRHCYPRAEVYHRFIHDDTYVYHKQNNPVWAKGNIIKVGSLLAEPKLLNIKECWGYHKEGCLAIIDRNAKRILIKVTYDKHVWDLTHSIPNDYEIFYTDESIPSYDILTNDEELFKLHLKYCVKSFIEQLYPIYNILNNKRKTIHFTIEDIFKYNTWNDERIYYKHIDYYCIYSFVKRHKINKYPWYKESFGFEASIKGNTYRSSTKITVPSLQKIINNTVFTPKEKLLVEQRYFWTKYRNGNSISFKNVVENWNKEYTSSELLYWFNKHNIRCYEAWVKPGKWTEAIKFLVECSKKTYAKYISEQIERSNKNYQEALKKLREKNIVDLEAWRKGQTQYYRKVEYERFILPRRRNSDGRWVVTSILEGSNLKFPVVQLRLILKDTTIQTSRGASVSLEDGIKLYRMFMIGRNNAPDRTYWDTKDFGNVKVGIYNLRRITYTDKYDSNHNPLGHKDWLIQIGCHDIWLEEVMDFIRYYRLERQFGIAEQKKIMLK